MTGRKMIYLGTAAIALAVALFGWKLTARGAYESAEYQVLKSDGPFEVREYPELTMATTPMRSNSQGDDGSFMRLFRYISGANDREQKVAMTTPVFVESETDGTDGQMGFVIPKDVTLQRVPEPSDDKVTIRKRPGGRYAVLRFSGRMNDKLGMKSAAKLRQWINDNGWIGEGEAEFAGYDPPWTPGPLRRNEVLIPLKPQP